MTNWIPTQIKLSGNLVDLITLQPGHIPELEELGKTRQIWDHYILDGSDSEIFQAAFNAGIKETQKGTQHAFVIHHKSDNKLIGSTRFLEINKHHKKLEIGWTWMHPDYWGTSVNTECKFLLLTYVFESLGATRLQLRTDELNMRSRKAIEKIGAKFEGIIRHDFIRDNGTNRDSAYYSILDSEWPEVKESLRNKLDEVIL